MTVTKTKRVLSLSTLFPNAAHPRFGIFVAKSLEALQQETHWDVTLVNPIGLPPITFGRYRALARYMREFDLVLSYNWGAMDGVMAHRLGGGDLPPMKVCAPTWRPGLLERLPDIELVLAIGGYAQRWHLGPAASRTLTETVRNWRTHMEAGILPTPHPSWRNNAWLKKNPWFAADLLPVLRARVEEVLR